MILFVVVAVSALLSRVTASTRQIVPFDYGWRFRTGLKEWATWDDLPPVRVDPGVDPKEAQVDYDASDWMSVQLPHDGLIQNPPSQKACPDGCSGRSYIPRHVLWYRKQFTLESGHHDDESFQYSLEFQGVFRNTTVWINGRLVKQHECGYTPFTVELTPQLLQLGRQSRLHTIAVFCDPDNGDEGGPSRGSGWWYEGGGIYRHVFLVRKYRNIHVVPDGLFVTSHVVETGDRDELGFHSTATKVHLDMTATIQAPRNTDGTSRYTYAFFVRDAAHGNRTVIASTAPRQIQFAATLASERRRIRQLAHENSTHTTFVVSAVRTLHHARLWNTRTPHMYQVDVVIYKNVKDEDGGTTRIPVDHVTTRHGIRTLHFDANHGLHLNSQQFKLRGFCDHDTFAVVGMAIPDRINLFRAQASRSIGANSRRTSHNPPDPALLDIYDRLGMLVMDENRLFANKTEYVDNMGDLVMRDRNHPSVIIWSFCNEVGCEGDHEAGGPAFQEITTKLDGTRPTLANMFTFNDLLSNTIDIQGFSHQHRDKLDDCHAQLPNKPILMSECCSCNTMRDEDEGCETAKDNPHYACNQKSFNARCLELLVNASDGVEYSSGTFVWTLFDYYGEPPSHGLTVSSSYGQYDLCGFPKAAATWFRTQWLLTSTSDDAERVDKPFSTGDLNEVYLVESWESPDSWNYTRGNNTRTIHAYTNAPQVELYLNDESRGVLPVHRMTSDNGTYAEFLNVPWAPGTIKVVARAANGTAVAETTKATNTDAHELVLSLDCPSPQTGTGNALYLDGQDVALVRATIVDALGQRVHMASHNISFRVVSGPGRIVGAANGDSKSYQPHHAPWQTAYHGLVRAIIQVTSMAALKDSTKNLFESIDAPSMLSSVEGSYPSFHDNQDIVLEASTAGLDRATLIIPTSTDRRDSVMAVASAGAGMSVDFLH